MFKQITKFFPQKTIPKYQMGMGLSLLSVFFGILREFVIVALLGLSSQNDRLQIYLSIFYSVSLSNDAIKLGVLNMCHYASLKRIFFAATLVALPYTFLIGLVFWFISANLSLSLLLIAIIGSFLNLVMILLVTYKQRYGAFLAALCVNVSPNFLLIPGILLIYLLAKQRSVDYIVYLYALLPLVQIIWLLFIKVDDAKEKLERKISFYEEVMLFLKQGIATIGEQFFQVILRSAFFKFGTGYLSLLSIFMRIFLAAKFIFIDTYIGSKLEAWSKKKNITQSMSDRLVSLDWVNILIILLALMFTYSFKINLLFFAMQLCIILSFSFYFDTLLRIVYYRINSYKHDARLVIGMGIFDGIFAGLVGLLSQFSFFSIMLLFWIWYILRFYLKMLYYRTT